MYFSYVASVIMLSLAIYGVWLLLGDIWELFLAPSRMQVPSVSFLVVVKDAEQEIEELLRYLSREIDNSGHFCDVVVVDCYSMDLTPLIVERLAEQFSWLYLVKTAVGSPEAALPLCRGGIIHVLELGTRLTAEDFMVSVSALLRRDQQSIRVARSH